MDNVIEREPEIRHDEKPVYETEFVSLLVPLPNYTLSSVCPNCSADMVKLACKVRCERCGFVWDCSEL